VLPPRRIVVWSHRATGLLCLSMRTRPCVDAVANAIVLPPRVTSTKPILTRVRRGAWVLPQPCADRDVRAAAKRL
jgi:hypothetical protein